MPVLNDTLTWKGAWGSGVDYVIDDAVIDSPDLVYVCTADHTSSLTNRPPNTGFWELVSDTPAASAYASVALYRNLIDKIDSGNDSVIADDLIAVSRLIDQKVFGQGSANRFTKDSSPQSRIFAPTLDRARSRRFGIRGFSRRDDWAESENPWFYGGFARMLNVDDFVSVSEIAIDQNLTGSFDLVLASNDYELLPRNALQGGEPRPYTQIGLTEWGTHGGWIVGSRVRVTGIWGWPAIPQAIVRATVQLTAILRLESPRATRTVTDLGQVTGMSRIGADIVNDLVSNYAKVTF